MDRLLVKFAFGVLKRVELTIDERNLCTGLLLDSVGAIPLHVMIASSDEGLLVNGTLLDFEKAQVLRDSAKTALTNQALNLIADQTRFTAFKQGLATGHPPADLLFFRAAIWVHELIKQHLLLLAQEGPELPG